MHRRLTFQGDTEGVRALAASLASIEGVIGLIHLPTASLKPAGDVLQVDVLNRDADEVLRRARASIDDDTRKMILVISQTNALIDRASAALIETDADEMLWEEIESDLRNHGRVSVNYVVLMALGGAVAACGFLLDLVPQAIALVGASIIAPGFEPIAKLAEGLVLPQMRLCRRALWSIGVGYLVLMASAAALTLVVSALAPGRPHALLTSEATARSLGRVEVVPVVASACAAVAGIIMVVSLRDLYVVGPLMVLVTISGVALAGAFLAVGEPVLALTALRRVGIDLVLIVGLGAIVFYWKQRRFHRRRPLR